MYKRQEHTVTGYEVSDIVDDSELYRAAYVGLADGAAASAARTDVGTTNMGLTETSFENTNSNFGNVVFNVTDGYITVEAREATLTSQSASKVYDGTPLTKVGVSAEGFADGEGVDWLMTGSQTVSYTHLDVYKRQEYVFASGY